MESPAKAGIAGRCSSEGDVPTQRLGLGASQRAAMLLQIAVEDRVHLCHGLCLRDPRPQTAQRPVPPFGGVILRHAHPAVTLLQPDVDDVLGCDPGIRGRHDADDRVGFSHTGKEGRADRLWPQVEGPFPVSVTDHDREARRGVLVIREEPPGCWRQPQGRQVPCACILPADSLDGTPWH